MKIMKTSLIALLCGATFGMAYADELDDSFHNPPSETKPRCYWYWMDGHITKEGITKDLEAMKRVGIGEGYIGVISGQSGMKPNPEPKALSEAWWDNIKYAIREGGRLGVDIGVFNSPGWSQSGGPWIKPEQAMRYVVLPETKLHGPQHFEGKLTAPTGEFQDVAVLAFPAPTGEGEVAKITARTPKRIQFEMPTPFMAASVQVNPVNKVNVEADLQASDDGKTYRSVKRFTIDRHNLGINVGPVPLAPVVASFPPTTAKFWRLDLSAGCELGDVRLSPELRIGSYAEKSLIKVFQDPLPPFNFYTWPPAAEPDAKVGAIAPGQVQNLTKLMATDGTLRWDVPAGDWVILRTAMTPTGTKNSPAPAEATGLEVDKMNRVPLKHHFDSYVGKLLREMPAADRKAWKHVVADSYEMGPQNWTDGFAADFQKRYGYDPLPWLPTLTGRVVGDADQSDRFLWDLRRLVADMVASEYVGGLHDLCAENGLKMWLENYGHWGFPAEFLQYGGASQEISGEFWVTGALGSVELRDASSAAHIYNKPTVWAEAFTGGPPFRSTPSSLKARGDWALCQGINQFVLHVYIHQPWDDKKPGINAWFGTEFNRHNTWFEQGKAWIDYLRRCSVMLKAGQSVADVAYFIGEDTPKMTGIRNPELPTGRDYDYINAEVIEKNLSVKNGLLTLPHGVDYRVLVLPDSTTMRPELLRRIRELVNDGATVLGHPPSRSPSMENFPKCDEEIRQLAREVWGEDTTAPSGEHKLGKGRVVWGKTLDEVFATFESKPDFQNTAGLTFKHRRQGDTEIYFVTNPAAAAVTTVASFRVADKLPELWSPDSGKTEQTATFKSADGITHLPIALGPHGSVFVVFRGDKGGFDPVIKVMRDGVPVFPSLASASSNPKATGGATVGHPVDVSRDATGNLSLETREPGKYELTTVSGKKLAADVAPFPGPQEITGAWEVAFEPGWGAPEKITFDKLDDWSKRAEPNIKHYSGRAMYRKTFVYPPALAASADSKLILDLGKVNDLATVRINGQELATLWLAPWELDITSAVKPGPNTLEIVVANTWNNRLVGDASLPADKRKTFLSTQSIKRGKPLLPAGLRGPVTLRTAKTIHLK